MALDPQAKQIFDHHLRGKINKNLACVVCGGTDWQDGELVGLPAIQVRDRATVNELGLVPHVSLTCPNCGFVMLFSCQVVGLVGVGEKPSLN